jgi:glycosyltransferase involved in cell wall biosynthesis
MSNALLEALAAGTPVVATDVPGTNEIVRHEREALLVPLDDPVALAAALERLLTDEALARSLGSRGRERVAETFSLESMVDRYAALFLEVAARRGRGTFSPARFSALHGRLAWTFARGVTRSMFRRMCR